MLDMNDLEVQFASGKLSYLEHPNYFQMISLLVTSIAICVYERMLNFAIDQCSKSFYHPFRKVVCIPTYFVTHVIECTSSSSAISQLALASPYLLEQL